MMKIVARRGYRIPVCAKGIATDILKPSILADVVNPNALHQLQSELLAGTNSNRGMPRSIFPWLGKR